MVSIETPIDNQHGRRRISEHFFNRYASFNGAVLHQHGRRERIVAVSNRTNPRIHQSGGHCLVRLRRYEDSLHDLSESLRLFSDYTKAVLSRGIAYAVLHRHTDAIEDFSKVITLFPESTVAFLNCTQAHLSIGQIENARKDVQAFETISGKTDPSVGKRFEGISREPPSDINRISQGTATPEK